MWLEEVVGAGLVRLMLPKYLVLCEDKPFLSLKT